MKGSLRFSTQFLSRYHFRSQRLGRNHIATWFSSRPFERFQSASLKQGNICILRQRSRNDYNSTETIRQWTMFQNGTNDLSYTYRGFLSIQGITEQNPGWSTTSRSRNQANIREKRFRTAYSQFFNTTRTSKGGTIRLDSPSPGGLVSEKSNLT